MSVQTRKGGRFCSPNAKELAFIWHPEHGRLWHFWEKVFFLFFGTRLLHIALRIGNCKFACNFEISSFYSHQLHKEVFLSCLGDLCWRGKKNHSLFFNVINTFDAFKFLFLKKKKIILGNSLEAYLHYTEMLHSMDTDVDDSVTFYEEYKNVIHYIYY